MQNGYPPIMPASLMARTESFEWLVGRVVASQVVTADEEYTYDIQAFPQNRPAVMFESCVNAWRPFGDGTKVTAAPVNTRAVVIILPGNRYECMVPEQPQYFDCDGA